MVPLLLFEHNAPQVSMNREGLKPFLEAVQELAERKDPRFLTKKVEGAFIILTLWDGDVLRAALATINADENDVVTAIVALGELTDKDLMIVIPRETMDAKDLN